VFNFCGEEKREPPFSGLSFSSRGKLSEVNNMGDVYHILCDNPHHI
jgi:hypothetical protein